MPIWKDARLNGFLGYIGPGGVKEDGEGIEDWGADNWVFFGYF